MPDQGAIAPPLIDRSGSGMISSSSTSIRMPRPVHSGQAPNGELNEKERGSSSSKEMSSYGQYRCSEYIRSRCGSSSGRSTKSSVIIPPARPSAVSIESVRRRLAEALTASRSTITSMVCFSCFLSTGGSASWITTPSTRARLYPLVCSSRNRSAYSPLRSRITGASTWKRVPSSSSSTRSTICCGAWREIGRPHSGQCGRPARAYRSRR